MTKSIRNTLMATAFAASLLSSGAADAVVLDVGVTGVQTFDAFQDTSNTVQLYNLGANAHVTGFAYDVSIATIGGSYLSEASIYYTNSAITAGVVTRPGFSNANSGTGTYTGSADLVALAIDFFVGADGILRVEYAESFDDNPNTADATFTRGTIRFCTENSPCAIPAATTVPEPATWAIMLLGFGLVGGALRHRKSIATTVHA